MKNRLTIFAVALVSTLLLSACTVTFTPEPLESEPQPVTNRPTPTPTPVPPVTPNFPLNETMTYQCSNARLGVRYTSNDSAQVFFGDWQNLTRTITTSGDWVYRNNEFTWRVSRSGRTGQLEQNGTVVRSNCTLV